MMTVRGGVLPSKSAIYQFAAKALLILIESQNSRAPQEIASRGCGASQLAFSPTEPEEVSVAATSGRISGRQSARSGAPGPAAEHRSKIIAVLATGVIVIVLVLGMTSQGHAIDAAVQRFMLYYAGVFALIGLTASVGVGLIATDRIVMTPGHRVMAQAVHRAVSFGALAFLIIHIVTEILAQRAHIIDGFVPFLSPFRTFYIGLGTIASDLIVLLIVTSIIRKRFTAHGKAWRWRAIHYSAYVAFVFGVLHGLLGGRPGKPYVDWSYGAAIALTAFGIGVRFLAISLRPKENLSAPPAGGRGGGSSPLHAATLTMAQAQLGGTIQSLPFGNGMQAAGMGLPAASVMELPAGSSYGAYGDGGYGDGAYGNGAYGNGAYGDGAYPDPGYGAEPLGAYPYGDGVPAYPQRALASLPAPLSAPTADTRQPLYEPGYVGPPRYEGAPRGGTGPMPRTATGPMPRADSSAMPTSAMPAGAMPAGAMPSGPRPTGPMPRLGSGPMPQVGGSGPMPQVGGSGPMPQVGGSGPMPQVGGGSGPMMPRGGGSGPMPQLGAGSGSMPPAGGSGPMPQMGTGPVPRAGTGPMPRTATGPMPRVDPGPMPRGGTGAMPRVESGPATRTGPMPRAGTGPMPQAPPGAPPGTGPIPATGQIPRGGTGPTPRPGQGSAGRRRQRPPADQQPDRNRSQRGGDAWR
jgi:DMSO/TMAO reductase YedYZ heme-binding membrane subunit